MRNTIEKTWTLQELNKVIPLDQTEQNSELDNGTTTGTNGKYYWLYRNTAKDPNEEVPLDQIEKNGTEHGSNKDTTRGTNVKHS